MKEFDHFETEIQCEEVFNEEPTCLGDEEGSCPLDNEPPDFRNDVEADADALASAGFGMDEDYFHDTPMAEQYGGE